MSDRLEARVGERNVPIPAFNGYKVIRAMELVGAIGEAYPTITQDIAKFTRDYESNHSLRITPDMSKMPRFKRWNLKPADFGDKGYLEIPRSPTFREQVVTAFPDVFKVAREPVTQLLALVIATNRELEEADDEGGDEVIDALLKKNGRKLLHEAQFEQLIVLAAVAAEAIKQQLAETEKESGNLLRLVLGTDDENDEAAEGNSKSEQG